ncbi:hypothetical protein LG651_01425 [Tamlana sp. 62-3]|uniref:Uncharacterized protein n=1 Tax=Neotamlana sargassicola TaxID=2883125 RepID=A0A9X1I2U6_9FLAO|nr:hypothetical protein [Tamlana sargassicola]MCB4806891.1 hypothetical protein [Tamlana sargassicola]
MKIFTYIISVIALGLIIFNSTKINTDAPFSGESMIALITIIAGLCVILLMTILRVSKQIEKKVKEKN